MILGEALGGMITINKSIYFKQKIKFILFHEYIKP